MKRRFFPAIFTLLLIFTFQTNAKAQTGALLGGNVLNGALTGTALGAATMALNNSDDFAALRVGLGAGILGGTGMALYDVVTLPSGQEFFISGTFNDGNNSSIIILLDTMYGAAGGAVLGSAIMLIGNQPVVDGIQYGAGLGAWAGFGFGLIDSFALSERNRDFMASSFLQRNAVFELSEAGYDIDLLRPGLTTYTDLTGNQLQVRAEPVLEMISLRKSF